MEKVNIPIIAIIPARKQDLINEGGQEFLVNGKGLLEYAITSAKESQYVDRIFVSTDDETVKQKALLLGAEVPFLRPKELSESHVHLPQVMHFTLQMIQQECRIEPEVVVLLEVDHPFRKNNLIDQVIEAFRKNKLDSAFTVIETKENFWCLNDNGEIKRVYEEGVFLHRDEKTMLYQEILGLVTVTKAAAIDISTILGERLGVVPVKDIPSQVDLKKSSGRMLAEQLILSQTR